VSDIGLYGTSPDTLVNSSTIIDSCSNSSSDKIKTSGFFSFFYLLFFCYFYFYYLILYLAGNAYNDLLPQCGVKLDSFLDTLIVSKTGVDIVMCYYNSEVHCGYF
jgi:hypothetical protein